MSKLFSRNALAVLALAFPVVGLADTTLTLQSGQILNLDTGATVSSGGDLLWDGANLTPQGSATAVDLQGEAPVLYSTLTSGTIAFVATGLASTPIQAPAANDLIIAKTNGGNYSKIDVTAATGTSITLKFNTFGGSTTSSGPTINSLQNNYSYIQPGLPSYGIAPGSLFIIFGSDLSDKVNPVLQSSAAPGLPTTLNHTSISVTVNGKTTTPGIYYTSPTQVAAVLPSSTPTGSGTITVTYNGTASAATPIQVVASAFGMDTLYGTGSGAIVATVGATVIVPTASASPGQTITIWGSGLGADTANTDLVYPLKQDNLKNAQVYIGGVKANVTYGGRSQYPGVDQVDVVVPEIGGSFQGGCGVSVVVVANNRASNFGTLPINPGGGVCSDPASGITGSQIGAFGGKSSFKSGFVELFQATEPSENSAARPKLKPEAQTFKTTYSAIADFQSVTGASYVSGGSFTSIGSCIVTTSSTSSGGGTATSTGLDAGNPIVLKGGGLNVNLPETATSGFGVGLYLAELTNPLMGGTAYTFTGTGGHDVGPFSATLTFPAPLTWTNETSISSVTESQGQLITWTGGANGSYVEIDGSSSNADASVAAAFVCLAPVSDQQFTIPSYVLLTLPTGQGSLGVANFATPVSFTATGIDYGYASAGVISDETVTYQ